MDNFIWLLWSCFFVLMSDMTLLLCHDCCVLKENQSCRVMLHACVCLSPFLYLFAMWHHKLFEVANGLEMPFSCGHFLFVACQVHCKTVDVNKGGRCVFTSSHCTNIKPKYPWYKILSWWQLVCTVVTGQWSCGGVSRPIHPHPPNCKKPQLSVIMFPSISCYTRQVDIKLCCAVSWCSFDALSCPSILHCLYCYLVNGHKLEFHTSCGTHEQLIMFNYRVVPKLISLLGPKHRFPQWWTDSSSLSWLIQFCHTEGLEGDSLIEQARSRRRRRKRCLSENIVTRLCHQFLYPNSPTQKTHVSEELVFPEIVWGFEEKGKFPHISSDHTVHQK